MVCSIVIVVAVVVVIVSSEEYKGNLISDDAHLNLSKFALKFAAILLFCNWIANISFLGTQSAKSQEVDHDQDRSLPLLDTSTIEANTTLVFFFFDQIQQKKQKQKQISIKFLIQTKQMECK